MSIWSEKLSRADVRVWSEKNGRADVKVYGFNWVDTCIVTIAGLIVLAACFWVIGGLS